jgi:hypothetical protein
LSAAACLDRAVASDAQLPDRLDDPGGVLGDHDRARGQHVTGSKLGVDRVALAATAPGVWVRLVDLEYLQTAAAQMPHEPRRIAAG